jgi:ketosteroid isomerase-like protein
MLSRLHNENELAADDLAALRNELRGPSASSDGERRAANKELVVRYLKHAHRCDWQAMGALLAEDATHYGPRPASPLEPLIRGRDNLLRELPSHTSLYQEGTVSIDIENIIAEGDFVDIQYIQRATTARGEPYENFYHYLFECENGKIKNYWEYIDTLYAQRLFDEL